ncbi:serine protease [Micromonospora auratinigra]|uniref:serine protease n=1 Tax=Micromonospora auratinigra TaxID=261654 RepID=UPI00142F6234|nr:serine protease [Micromonospora auratinigra]
MRAADRVLALAADRGQGHEQGRYCYGSGFLVSGRTVLTCAHVVAGAQVVLLDDARGNQYTGRVVGLGNPAHPGDSDRPDLALVEVDAPELDAPPFPLGEIDRSSPGTLDPVRAFGWPRFMELEGARGGRSVFSATGVTNVLSRFRDGLLRIDVNGSPPAPDGHDSPWEGFSGAPVIVDGRLVGVVTIHGTPEGPTALTAIPLTLVEAVPGQPRWGRGVDDPDAWWAALGLRHPGDLDIVRPGPKLPLCLAHHQTVIGSLRGYRSNLLNEIVPYVPPSKGEAWHPDNLWKELASADGPGTVLLTGHGGIGKTRTLMEVAKRAVDDGWTVLHVRHGNAAPAAEFLATFIQDSFSPVLVVIDYLNLSLEKDLDLPQLTSLVQQNRQGARPHAAVLASARTGWLLSGTHARDVADFTQVQIVPTAADLGRICESLAVTAAPEAERRLTRPVLLSYTGVNRPILSLLVAREIEARVAREAPPLPYASMDAQDLGRWLEIRLDEDRLFPGVNLVAGPWTADVDPHIEAAAAVFLAAPCDREGLLDVAASLLDRPSSPAHIVRLLVDMGWLAEYNGICETVHDIVTDFLLGSVLFWRSTGELRPLIAGRLLDAAGRRLTTLEHAAVALSRLLDELESDGRDAGSLRREINDWFESNLASVAALLLADPAAGSRAAATILRSHILGDGVERYWAGLFAPVLTALGPRIEAYPLLMAAVREIPPTDRELSTALVDQALSWLTGRNLAGIDQLLRFLLRRDLTRAQTRTAIRLGTAWLDRHFAHLSSDFLLNSLLATRGLPQAELWHLAGLGLGWLREHGTQSQASFLLVTMLRQGNLPPDVVPALARCAAEWMRRHGGQEVASFVIPPLLGRHDLPGDVLAAALAGAEAWLAEHGEVLHASFVLRALLTCPNLPSPVRRAVLDRSRNWLGRHADTPEASYLLPVLLVRPTDLPEVVVPAADGWLRRHGDSADAAFVLHGLWRADDLPEDVRRRTYEVTNRWLAARATMPEARNLLQVLLQDEVPEPVRRMAYEAAEGWLAGNGTTVEATFLIQVLLQVEEAPESVRRMAYEAAERWLIANGTTVEATFLLQVLLQVRPLPEPVREPIHRAVRDWLAVHATALVEANHLLQVLIAQRDGLPEAVREVTYAAVRRWLGRHRKSPTARFLLEALLGTTDLPDEVRQSTFDTVQQWLARHGGILEANHLLQKLLHHGGLPESLPELTDDAAVRWLAANGTVPEAKFLLQVLLRRHPLPESLRDPVLTAALGWLERHFSTSAASFPYFNLERRTDLPARLRHRLIRLVLRWTSLPENRVRLRPTLYRLLHEEGLPAECRQEVLTAAVEWLTDNAGTRRAGEIIPAVLQAGDLPPQLRPAALAATRAWLTGRGNSQVISVVRALFAEEWADDPAAQSTVAEHVHRVADRGDQASSRFELRTLLDQPALSPPLRAVTLLAVRRWLERHGNQPQAALVLVGLLQRTDLTPAEYAWLEPVCRDWLDECGGQDRAGDVLRLLLQRSSALTPQGRAGVAARATAWLAEPGAQEAHADTAAALRTLLAVAGD